MLNTVKNVKIMFLAVYLIKSFVLMINLASQLFFTGEKMQFLNLLMQFSKSMIIAQKLYKSTLIKI